MTSPQDRPAWLTEATARASIRPRQPAEIAAKPADPARGQVRRLDPMDLDGTPSRLVLIVDVDASSAAAQVVLLSNEVEMGSETDGTLSASDTGLPYDLLALFDVTSPAWYVQLGVVLATVDLDVLEPLAPAGTPITGPNDERWSWKQSEHDALVALTGECARQVIDESADSLVDPSAFDLTTVSEMEFASIARATAPLVRAERLRVPVAALVNLERHRVSVRSGCWESFRCLFELLRDREHLWLDEMPSEAPLQARAHVLDDRLPAAIGSAFRRMPSTHRSLQLFTVESLSATGFPTSQPGVRQVASGVWEVLIDDRRHQLVVHAADRDLAGLTSPTRKGAGHV